MTTDKVEVSGTEVTVDIQETETQGSRETDVPVIAVVRMGEHEQWTLLLTWQQADALAAALTEVTAVARYG